MLVLTRKKDEGIMIGRDIEIMVLGFDGDKVRLGISAPRSITILRKEVYQEVADANKEALSSNLPQNFDLKELFR
jgi:carbon storage regulator (csrA)